MFFVMRACVRGAVRPRGVPSCTEVSITPKALSVDSMYPTRAFSIGYEGPAASAASGDERLRDAPSFCRLAKPTEEDEV